ncbi:MAG: delta-aminolevulinic acid dehydratase, partial [Omnitrophica WOR_2 bacterium RIFOXYB2_FULL_45_11]
AMPGVFRFSQDELLKEIEQLKRSGVSSVILFGLPGEKDDAGRQAYSENGVIQKVVRALKKNFGDELAVITDVCLCGYTKHGHCGVIKKSHKVTKSQGHQIKIDNNKTINILAKIALSHARAGADIVAPSAMMDGQVAAIREGLDKNGFGDTAIMGYSAKFASNFYGPFREAAGSGMKFGDRKSYQMDFRNSDEALREIEADIQEGADIVMVKPALAYLDIIARAKEKFSVPLAAFNVSGEYAMVRTYLKMSPSHQVTKSPEMEKQLVLEILTAIKRAGADIIITYWAKDAAKWLK